MNNLHKPAAEATKKFPCEVCGKLFTGFIFWKFMSIFKNVKGNNVILLSNIEIYSVDTALGMVYIFFISLY